MAVRSQSFSSLPPPIRIDVRSMRIFICPNLTQVVDPKSIGDAQCCKQIRQYRACLIAYVLRDTPAEAAISACSFSWARRISLRRFSSTYIKPSPHPADRPISPRHPYQDSWQSALRPRSAALPAQYHLHSSYRHGKGY